MGNLRSKLPPAGYERIIAKGNYARCLVLSCRRARDCSGKPTGKRIGAFRGLGAESPVFLPAPARAKKCAKNSGMGVQFLVFRLYALLIQGLLFW
jgi:hypothetical protein